MSGKLHLICMKTEGSWQASFPTGTVGPRVEIFLSPLNTNDGFYLSHPHTNYVLFF